MNKWIIREVYSNGPRKHGELLVLLALAHEANEAGVCCPSIQRIANMARMTTRSAQRNIRNLEALGWIKVEIGAARFGYNRYTVTPSDVGIFSRPDGLTKEVLKRINDGRDIQVASCK